MKKHLVVGSAVAGSLVIAGAAFGAAPLVASPGASPFTGCTADHVAEQQQGGSRVYPGSEIEPRSARFGTTIVGEYQQDRWSDGGARGLVASVSHDNGASWHRVLVPGLTACVGGGYLRASDPWVSFAPDHTLYAISLSFFGTSNPNDNAILVSRSTDLGDSWEAPVALAADSTDGLDKESITADPNDANYVYAAWDRVLSPGGSLRASDQGLIHSRSFKSQTFIARTTNGGSTWEKPQQVFVDSSFSGSIGSIVRVGSGSTVLDGLLTYGSAAWKGGPCGSVAVLRSTDRGDTWEGKPVIVAPYSCTYGGAHNPDSDLPLRTGGLVDFQTRGSNAYLVWEDAVPSRPTRGQILFSESSDNGRTWSTPIVVSHTRSVQDVDAFIPSIAVNSAGKVGVAYYDFRNDQPGGIASTDLWLTTCGGTCSSQGSWSADMRVTPSSFDMSAAPVAGGQFLGDYMGITTSGTSFEPFFIQSGTPPVADGPTDAFFATLP
ncbi:MAG TPA: sialidase family protein [Actinomycetes bacterium]|nr:sialidase family protein [Actinomycetes bacterium]